MIKKDQVYSTAEICEMFGISKSTLFRWEREDLLPRIPRDISGQRQYNLDHITAISERQKKQLGKRYADAIKTGDESSLQQISEAVAIRKFLEGDITGLYELAELPEVSSDTLLQIMQIGLEQYEPGDHTFCEIVRVLWEHTRDLCHD
ncbi:MAG: MerR family DNA-binding transcriptional regulator [Anaerolineales bacterium]|nr:MerR family DNA-binding transcriptional regulator [Anaerolineales bacterium]